ncbi:T9SS type A sorting domain-containing protein [candidate division KSB1 bacterium]|nr:T9SS type A sorting domain-containing protein [candidate division KSB1 bacterium]
MKKTLLLFVVILLSGGFLFSQEIPTVGLVAYYTFDEEDPLVVKDHSALGLDGEIMGEVAYEEGVVGKGLYFNGADTYVNCYNPAELNMEFELTLMAWVYPQDINDGGQHDPWISKGDNQYALKNGAGAYFEFFIYDDGWHAPNIPLDESYDFEWHHYAGTYDGYELKMFIDGEMLLIDPWEGTIDPTDYDFYLGSNSQATGRFFNGILDEVAVYEVALSEEDIADIYKSYFSNSVEKYEKSATEFTLNQNYPNPFNPTTQITYNLPADQFVDLKVFDILGKEICCLVNEKQSAGLHSVRFDATGLAGGVYFYKLKTEENVLLTRKMVLMK